MLFVELNKNERCTMFWLLKFVEFLRYCIVFRRSLLRIDFWYFVTRIECFPVNDQLQQNERKIWDDQSRIDNCRLDCFDNNVSYKFIITWLSTCYDNLFICNCRVALIESEFIYKHDYVFMNRIEQIMKIKLLKKDEREQIVEQKRFKISSKANAKAFYR